MRTELTTPHEKALMLLFAELESTAAEQREAFLGTPGALTERTNENGTRSGFTAIRMELVGAMRTTWAPRTMRRSSLVYASFATGFKQQRDDYQNQDLGAR